MKIPRENDIGSDFQRKVNVSYKPDARLVKPAIEGSCSSILVVKEWRQAGKK